MIKKITDERLVLKNLKNIRIAFLVQTTGIIAILGYDLVTKGMDGMTENPLWFVMMITAIVLGYLSMNISIDYESNNKNPLKGLSISLLVFLFISIMIGFFVTITDGFSINDGFIIGGIIFICGLIPSIYIYILRKKQQNE